MPPLHQNTQRPTASPQNPQDRNVFQSFAIFNLKNVSPGTVVNEQYQQVFLFKLLIEMNLNQSNKRKATEMLGEGGGAAVVLLMEERRSQ